MSAIAGVTAVILAAVTLVVMLVLHRRNPSDRGGWSKVLGVGFLVASLVAVVMGGAYWFTESSPPASTATTSTPAPPPAPPPKMARAAVTVKADCRCEGPRDQGQVKVQISVTNTGEVPINASIENIRLLLAGPMPGPWTPNGPVTQPSTVVIGDQSYTAIPANGNRLAEPWLGSRTFASHWPAGPLEPGQSFSGDGPNQADLVFYVPHDPNGEYRVGGIAVVTNDGSTALGWSLVGEWPLA